MRRKILSRLVVHQESKYMKMILVGENLLQLEAGQVNKCEGGVQEGSIDIEVCLFSRGTQSLGQC